MCYMLSWGLIARYFLEVWHCIKLLEKDTWLVVTKGGGSGGDVVQRVQMPSYKMNKVKGSNVQHNDYSYYLINILGSC